MITSPSLDDLLESVVLTIGADILPHLENEKAVATAAMMQSVLTGVRQMLPVYDGIIVEEHNQMTQVLRDVATQLQGSAGDAADRIRERAAGMGATKDLPAPPDSGANRAAHRSLSKALADTMTDVDALQRDGDVGADEALNIVRTHLASRLHRYAGTISIEGGMLGRG